jgi:hypothetical protein
MTYCINKNLVLEVFYMHSFYVVCPKISQSKKSIEDFSTESIAAVLVVRRFLSCNARDYPWPCLNYIYFTVLGISRDCARVSLFFVGLLYRFVFYQWAWVKSNILLFNLLFAPIERGDSALSNNKKVSESIKYSIFWNFLIISLYCNHDNGS